MFSSLITAILNPWMEEQGGEMVKEKLLFVHFPPN